MFPLTSATRWLKAWAKASIEPSGAALTLLEAAANAALLFASNRAEFVVADQPQSLQRRAAQFSPCPTLSSGCQPALGCDHGLHPRPAAAMRRW